MTTSFVAILCCVLIALPQTLGFAANSIKSNPNVKLLILPGFGNDQADYLLDRSLVSSLEQKGWCPETQIKVLPVQRADWLKVFLRGALDWSFWQSEAPPTNPAFRWYLDCVAQEMAELKDDERMVIVGHSAGGWLARAALGYGSGDDHDENEKSARDFNMPNFDKILGLVTLGAPHLPPPEGLMDMTQGGLRLTNENYPGAYHVDSLFYITVLGLSVQGKKDERKSPLDPRSIQGFAYDSYKAVCGQGDIIGDGVVPQCAGHLEGAKQFDLVNVLHSINNLDSWYGASGVIDTWHDPMLKEIETRLKPEKKQQFNLFEMIQGKDRSRS